MPVALDVDDLIAYTAWERERWHAWFRANPAALGVSAGPHGDGRFATVGDLVRHVFNAEMRYVQRLTDQPLTDLARVSADDPEALFAAAGEIRLLLTGLLQSIPPGGWDTRRQFRILSYDVTATPKKIVVHVLLHEIRHWAQIATLCRLSGFVCEPQDFLASPVWNGEVRLADEQR